MLLHTAKPILITVAFLLSIVVANSFPVYAEGRVVTRVQVDGRDHSGGIFWLVILPADIKQPVSPEQARQYAVRTTNGVAEVSDLEPGKYLVALVAAPSELKERAPLQIEVLAPEWDQSRPGATGHWPAYEVEIGPQTADVAVNFVRKEYPALPPGFVFPHTHPGHLEPRGSIPMSASEKTLLYAGAALIAVSMSTGAITLMRFRRHAGGNPAV